MIRSGIAGVPGILFKGPEPAVLLSSLFPNETVRRVSVAMTKFE
jgi:hypothetical protein